MSERREKIAKALHELDVQLREADGDFGVNTAPWDETGDDTRTMFREYADVALAAIDAEPTEAEIIAAREMWFRLPDDMTADECMRRVLIAARTARQGGER